MNEDSFLMRMLGRHTEEDETGIGSAEAFGIRRPKNRSVPEVGERQLDFAFAIVVETIEDLPSNIPRDSAVRIVKRTLAAAGIEIGEFNKRTCARIPQISHEIELAHSREQEFKEKTERDIRALEGEIRKAREAYETIRAEKEEEISRASKELENIKRVRAFFGFSDMEGDEEVSPGGEAAAEVRGPLGIGSSVQQERDSVSSYAFFSPPDIEGEDDSKAGADSSTHGPVEGSSSDSDPQDIRRLDHIEDDEEVAERDCPVHLHRDEEKRAGN